MKRLVSKVNVHFKSNVKWTGAAQHKSQLLVGAIFIVLFADTRDGKRGPSAMENSTARFFLSTVRRIDSVSLFREAHSRSLAPPLLLSLSPLTRSVRCPLLIYSSPFQLLSQPYQASKNFIAKR